MKIHVPPFIARSAIVFSGFYTTHRKLLRYVECCYGRLYQMSGGLRGRTTSVCGVSRRVSQKAAKAHKFFMRVVLRHS